MSTCESTCWSDTTVEERRLSNNSVGSVQSVEQQKIYRLTTSSQGRSRLILDRRLLAGLRNVCRLNFGSVRFCAEGVTAKSILLPKGTMEPYRHIATASATCAKQHSVSECGSTGKGKGPEAQLDEQRAFNPLVASSTLARPTSRRSKKHGLVAQTAEQLALNQEVVGSMPTESTIRESLRVGSSADQSTGFLPRVPRVRIPLGPPQPSRRKEAGSVAQVGRAPGQ